MTLKGKANFFSHSNCCDKFNLVCHLATDVGEISLALNLSYICLQPFLYLRIWSGSELYSWEKVISFSQNLWEISHSQRQIEVLSITKMHFCMRLFIQFNRFHWEFWETYRVLNLLKSCQKSDQWMNNVEKRQWSGTDTIEYHIQP